jgi:hypothetical protein
MTTNAAYAFISTLAIIGIAFGAAKLFSAVDVMIAASVVAR